jgi:hypothetical protein
MQQENSSDSRAIALLVAAHESTPVDFVKYHHIKNEAGIELEFTDHKFIVDFMQDMSPLQVMLKAPQIGATVAELVKTFWCAYKKEWDIIYTLPTQSDVNDMAGGKINRIIAQNPIFLSWTRDHDTVEQKAVGKNIIYYRGTWTTKEAMMVTSDLNVHDEVDASNQQVIQQYETRLQAKKDSRRWYFSHPLLGGMGVDKYWQQSDKKEWFIKCNHCNVEQQLKWPDNVDLQRRSYICSHCLKDLTQEVRRSGHWQPTSSGIFSGYHISQLMCPWITAEKICIDWETKDKQYFWNYVLGLPYISSENKISPDVILKACTDAVNDQTDRIIIGVDTGLPVHYTLLNKQGVFYYGKCREPSATYSPYDDIEKFLKRWPTSFVVSDQGGDLIGIRKLQAKYPGRVFLAYYRRDTTGEKMIKWGEKEDFGIVTIDRNRMIQMIVEHFRDIGRIRLNGTRDEWLEFASHFGNIYRELVVMPESPGKDQGTLYKNQYVWKRNGPDHFVHALVYAMTGLDKYATREGTVVMPDMFGEMPIGRLDISGLNALNRVIDNTDQFGF